MKCIKKSVFYLVTVLALIVVMIGGYGVFTAPEKKASGDEEKLKKELVENEKILKTEEKEVSKVKVSKKTVRKKRTVTAIGDSVMLGAALAIKKKIPNCIVDAKKSRQVIKCKLIIKKLKKQGELGDVVVIALGTNGPFQESVGQSLISYIGQKHKIYWVMSYGKHLKWMNDVNDTIQQIAKRNKNVKVLNWPKVAKSNPDWFYSDGIHLKKKGQSGYARFLADGIK